MKSEAADPRFHDLVPEDIEVERISTGHLFTEGPVWNVQKGVLMWVDIAGDTIWQWAPGVGRSVFMQPSGKANGMTIDREGRLTVAGWTSRCMWRLEHDGSIVKLATHLDGVRIGTPNDIVVKSDGSVYWTDGTSGTRHAGFETNEDLQVYRKKPAVLRWDPVSGDVTLMTDQSGACNGIAFSPDESILYVNDSGRNARWINAFDVQPDGSLANGRVFAAGTGSATKVDSHGNVFCTGAGGVRVYDPDGTFLGRIPVPEKESNLAWGEDGWRTLFVTSGTSVYRVSPLLTQGIPVGLAGRMAR